MKDQRQPTPVERTERVFARRLRELREERGLTQARLSTELGRAGLKLDDLAILRIEKAAGGLEGARRIRLGEAAVIAKALGVRLNDMIRDTSSAAEKFSQAVMQLSTLMEQRRVVSERLRTLETDLSLAEEQVLQAKKLLTKDERSDDHVQMMIGILARQRLLAKVEKKQTEVDDRVDPKLVDELTRRFRDDPVMQEKVNEVLTRFDSTLLQRLADGDADVPDDAVEELIQAIMSTVSRSGEGKEVKG